MCEGMWDAVVVVVVGTVEMGAEEVEVEEAEEEEETEEEEEEEVVEDVRGCCGFVSMRGKENEKKNKKKGGKLSFC